MPDLYNDPEYVWGELNRLAEAQEAAQWNQFATLASVATATLVAALTFYLLAQLLTRRQQQLERLLAIPQHVLRVGQMATWSLFAITATALLIGLVTVLSMSVAYTLWR